MIHMDENERRQLEKKVDAYSSMPAFDSGGADSAKAFRDRWQRNRDGNTKRDIINSVEIKKEEEEEEDFGSWEDREEEEKAITGKIKEEKDIVDSSEEDRRMATEFAVTQEGKDYKRILQFRMELPAFKKRAEILDRIDKSQVVVVSGETGCGKTTQVPQFILDSHLQLGKGSKCRIVCTQPRRISAISIAERVAEERGERVGGSSSSVGYQIRLESRLPREKGSILYCTTGVVLQWMRSNPDLEGYSHIVLDEIHERDILSDFLITVLKDVLKRRKDLKVILMSATLNADLFSRYFGGAPTINIPGFTFPVEEFYLEDVLEMTRFRIAGRQAPAQKWHAHTRRGKDKAQGMRDYEDFIGPYLRDLQSRGTYSAETLESLSFAESEEINHELIATVVHYIHTTKEDGAILVFLPGWDDISKVNRLLTEDRRYSLMADGGNVQIFPLHSLMPTASQKSIFSRPPVGTRKVVIATNIAGTSITIDDVVFVVDCGKIKMNNFDVKNNLSTLKPEWVSLANARQRRGRAGRVQAGFCYHLYSKAREMTMTQFMVPEMLRTKLEEVILQIKILEFGRASAFLNRVMEPPDDRAVDLAIDMLCNMNALDVDEQLTPLGFHLAQLPMDPQTGKMILFGAIFNCLDPVLSVAASLSFKDPFLVPLGKEEIVDERKRELANGSRSDHLMMANVMMDWEQSVRDGRSRNFCWDNFLSESTLRMLDNMKRQFAEHLCNLKFLSSKDVRDSAANRNSGNEDLVRAVICAGLYPNVASVRIRRNKFKGAFPVMQTATERKVDAHPKSVNSKEADFRHPWVVYHLKMKSTGVYIYDSSEVSPMSLLFFGRHFRIGEDRLDDGTVLETIAVDNFVTFNCRNKTSVVFRELRRALDDLLTYKVSNPGVTDWDERKREGAVLGAIVDLLTCRAEGDTVEDDCDDYY